MQLPEQQGIMRGMQFSPDGTQPGARSGARVPAAELSEGRASAVVARTDRRMKLELKRMVMAAIKWLYACAWRA
jgi:hypothetical protein